MRGRIILGVCGALLVAAIIWMLSSFGLPPLFLIAWVLVVVAVGIITRQSDAAEPRIWPPEQRRSARGSDVSRLAWAINSHTGVVGPGLVRRVRAVLVHRLALRGLDLDDEAHHTRIDRLLGPGIRDIIDARVIQRSDLDRVLDVIDDLPPTMETT